MTLKEFVHNFDLENPDWSQLPEGFPKKCNLEELSLAEVGRFNGINAVWELSQPERPKSRSRIWTDPEGYRYLVAWSNAVLLRSLVRLLTDGLPKSEYRRKAQLDDAARSTVRNIEEGYKRSTTSHYIEFIGFSQASLEEVKGDIRELTEDGFLASRPGTSLAGVGIDLKDFHEALKWNKGNKGMVEENKENRGGNRGGGWLTVEEKFAYHPLTILYPPLAKIRAGDLSYEIFLELINKTDWNLRKLVQSLEHKLNREQKYYQVEQLRIKSNLKWRTKGQ